MAAQRLHPDFFCVAAQKTGTGWFYDQARSHPGIWMPPIKELRYFNAGFGQLKERAEERLAKLTRDRRREPDPRDIEFLRRAGDLQGKPDVADLAPYTRLFEPAGELATGDLSPSNHRLDEHSIESLAAGLPACRFVFLLRDPIARFWSQLNMQVRGGKSPASALSEMATFQQYVRHPLFVVHSFQSNVIERWQKIVGEERFRVFVMDDLVSDPEGYRRALFMHIGLDGDACAIPAGFNKKADAYKAAMPAEFRAHLLDYFAEEYDRLGRLTNNRPLAWMPVRQPISTAAE